MSDNAHPPDWPAPGEVLAAGRFDAAAFISEARVSIIVAAVFAAILVLATGFAWPVLLLSVLAILAGAAHVRRLMRQNEGRAWQITRDAVHFSNRPAIPIKAIKQVRGSSRNLILVLRGERRVHVLGVTDAIAQRTLLRRLRAEQ